MAKKKRRSDGGDPRGRRRSKQPELLPDLPDPREREALLPQFMDAGNAATPLDKAHKILVNAYREKDENRRLQLAKQALEICPDCADAYVLLAEHAPDHQETLELYEKGVQAGERALGPRAFEEHAGHFWGVLQTRPYMRARLGLANELWIAGRRLEAIQHMQDMLRLNPNDNQGVRYTLAGFLLSQDRDDDLAKLLRQFPEEESATWAYTKTLLAFRHKGEPEEARKLLQSAIKANKHVPVFLLGREPLPEEQPPYYSPGKESEAIIYAGIFLRNWKGTPGAITWLRQATRKPQPQPQPKGPLSFIKKWLSKNLPQANDIWQADFRQVPDWLVIAGEKVRPWTVLVANRSDDLVLAHGIVEEPPSANHLWDTLVLAMQQPVAGKPHRPAELQVRPDERWTSLQPHLEEIGIALVQADRLEQMDEVFHGMHQHLVGTVRPGLLEMPGVTFEQVGDFFQAAAGFYRQAPWKMVGDDATLKVECAKYQSGPWYLVIMGQAGLTLGLALYEDLRIVRKTQLGNLSEEEHARHAVVLSLTYGEQTELTGKDLEAIKEHGWQLAGPEAYPCVFKKERGMSIRPPLAWEIELLAGCLRAIPEFVGRRHPDDPAQEEMTVPVASGELKLALSWVLDSTQKFC